jgi:hypothetical protein
MFDFRGIEGIFQLKNEGNPNFLEARNRTKPAVVLE